jgi:ABC-type uncharacterized transport system auxiliary subunit
MTRLTVIRFVACAFCALSLVSCLSGLTSKPPYTVNLYTLEYTLRLPSGGSTLDDVIKIDRFSTAQSYNTTSMLSRPGPYRVTAYNYSKWQTYPGDMVTDHLLEDFRSSGLFHAVLSYRDGANYRFVVGGSVEEFVQTKVDGKWQAIISLQVRLVDTGKVGMSERIIFQRRYRSEVPIATESPESFAAAMSKAMSKVSTDILKDVYQSVMETTDEHRSFR